MFDVLRINSAALVISGLLAGIVIDTMSLRSEFYGGGGRLLGDVVTHVGDGPLLGWGCEGLSEQREAGIAPYILS